MRSAGFAFRFSLFSLLLISGCATVPSPPPVENPAAAWQARQARLRAVSAWTLQGRLAMRAAAEGWQASVHWMHDGARQQIDLTGPLGRGHLRLTQDSGGAELRDADRKTWRAENAQQLLYRATGWLVPLDGLNYWILGLPAPGPAAKLELDDQGRLKTLDQSGWDIRFLEYARQGSLDLPSRIFIKTQGGANATASAQDVDVEVRLIIERWTLDGKNSEAPAAR
jgi:outer membrane lipoprotein LolB